MTNNKDRKPDISYITEYERAKVQYKVYITPPKVRENKPKDKEESTPSCKSSL